MTRIILILAILLCSNVAAGEDKPALNWFRHQTVHIIKKYDYCKKQFLDTFPVLYFWGHKLS